MSIGQWHPLGQNLTGMFDLVQLLALVFFGGFVAGEIAFRYFSLPRAIAYVALGILAGPSGLGWLESEHNQSAQGVIDFSLGLILFELGYSVPNMPFKVFLKRLVSGTDMAMATGLSIVLVLFAWGFSIKGAVFSAILCLATSPAITMITCSDMGAKGEKTDLLYTMVAVNGLVGFIALTVSLPFLLNHSSEQGMSGLWLAFQRVWGAYILGGACCGLALVGSELFGRKPWLQKLLVYGIVFSGIGLTAYLDVSALIPMLAFGLMTRILDRDNNFVAMETSVDARLLSIVPFVLAGAALDIANLGAYWAEVGFLVMARFLAQGAFAFVDRKALGLTGHEAIFLAVGLQPLSCIALLMLGSAQSLHLDLAPRVSGTLLATILVMQVIGPLATKFSLVWFGEANCAKAAADGSRKFD